MRNRRPLACLAILLAGLLAGAASPRKPACEAQVFEGARFTVCRFDAAEHELRLVWRGGDGRPLLRLSRIAARLGADARRVRYAMNAGMYDPAHAPLGLYVEAGAEVRPLRNDEGRGNFYLKPNGVFSQDRDGTLRVETAEAFAARRAAPLWATQSGPMLVIEGALHPAFQPDGSSRLIRNGVGVCDDAQAVFVISEEPVSFGKFARFFRDGLGCPNALYLDGSVSALWAPGLRRLDSSPPLGPMVVVLDRSGGEPERRAAPR